MMDVTSVAGDSAHVTSRQTTLLSKVASRPVLLEMCFTLQSATITMTAQWPITCLPAKSLFVHKSSCKALTKTTMLRNV